MPWKVCLVVQLGSDCACCLVGKLRSCRGSSTQLLCGVQVSLRDVISSTVEMVAADATKKGLDLAYTMDDALLRRTVLGDAIRIRQVRRTIRQYALLCWGTYLPKAYYSCSHQQSDKR